MIQSISPLVRDWPKVVHVARKPSQQRAVHPNSLASIGCKEARSRAYRIRVMCSRQMTSRKCWMDTRFSATRNLHLVRYNCLGKRWPVPIPSRFSPRSMGQTRGSRRTSRGVVPWNSMRMARSRRILRTILG